MQPHLILWVNHLSINKNGSMLRNNNSTAPCFKKISRWTTTRRFQSCKNRAPRRGPQSKEISFKNAVAPLDRKQSKRRLNSTAKSCVPRLYKPSLARDHSWWQKSKQWLSRRCATLPFTLRRDSKRRRRYRVKTSLKIQALIKLSSWTTLSSNSWRSSNCSLARMP